MSRLIAVLLATGLLALSCRGDSAVTRIRGELIWNDERQTMQACGSSDVLWVRVLASNPHFLLIKRVQELTAGAPTTSIVAELEGTLEEAPTSAGPSHKVDRTLIVSRIVSVERGSCFTSEGGLPPNPRVNAAARPVTALANSASAAPVRTARYAQR